VGGDVKMTVIRDSGGVVLFFNRGAPYMNGSEGGNEKKHSWRGPGIGYIAFTSPPTSGEKWWTFAFSVWYPIIIFGILPLVLTVKKLRAVNN